MFFSHIGKKIYVKFFAILFLAMFFLAKNTKFLYAYDISKVLVDANIVDNLASLDKEVRRDEFAKMVVKSSVYKDYVSDANVTSICNDVASDNIYIPYIKSAIDNKLMFVYLGGKFKPDVYVTYNDLTRACLALLEYEDADFSGNKVAARNLKFEALGLDENIDKTDGNKITKLDIMNAIYNTLKHEVKSSNTKLYEKVFDKMYMSEDKELISIGLNNTKVKGPFIAKYNEKEIDTPFDYKENDIYINGLLSDEKAIDYDMSSFGYIVYYYDIENKKLYAYSERDDVQTTIAVKTGYVNEVKYNANSMITPVYAIIEGQKYLFGNEEAKLKFSYSGSIKMDDRVVFIFNKMADVVNDDEKDSGMPIKGRIVNAFLYSELYM